MVLFWIACIVAIVFLDIGLGDKIGGREEGHQSGKEFIVDGIKRDVEIFDTVENSGDQGEGVQEIFTYPEI